MPVAKTPRVLWIELTSKCPFDCVFCSRKLRRGGGRHLPYPVYRRLVESLADPRKLILNYSGESLCYPELVPAIELARGRGAFVELVSAFSSIQPGQMRALAFCGLGRLTVSVHAADESRYKEIYRHGSFVDLEARLREFLAICQQSPAAPAVDFAFVAMQRNLAQLEPVAEFARRMGVRDIAVFPVMRRDDIPVHFPRELDALGKHTGEFRRLVRETVTQAERDHEEIRFSICDPAFNGTATTLGEIPVPYPNPLPQGARIHACEQNPWETAHVLSNGDVVVCEILDKVPMGNLCEQTMDEIWHGARYRDFRERYHLGLPPECRDCVWKRAYLPGPLKSDILPRDGDSAQLLYGWHERAADEDAIWSTQQAAAVLRPRPGSRSIHVSAMLPPGPPENPNELVIASHGHEVGRVSNPCHEMFRFGFDFAMPDDAGVPWELEFRTRHVLRPRDRGLGPDRRDLGFALMLLASNRAPDGEQWKRCAMELAPLRRLVERVDGIGARLRRGLKPRFRLVCSPRGTPGVSVVIPERNNPEELAACLESLMRASEHLSEPVQAILVASGAEPGAYEALRREYRCCEWIFSAQALGFNEAIRRGLGAARFEWVYLLNSDVALDADAIRALLPWRAAGVFAIGSQIFLKDATRYRDETNWGALLTEDGLATIHDRIPPCDDVTECFYVGGGASLFQRRVLTRLAAASNVYAPFYWEDVEWGWRAQKRGYRVLFCPASVARHRQRATVAKHYPRETIEQVFERNRLLFQLRNMTASGSLDRLFEEIARLPAPAAAHFLRRSVVWDSMRVRLWNHFAAKDDSEVIEA